MKNLQKIIISSLIIILMGCGQKGPLLLTDSQTQVNTNVNSNLEKAEKSTADDTKAPVKAEDPAVQETVIKKTDESGEQNQ